MQLYPSLSVSKLLEGGRVNRLLLLLLLLLECFQSEHSVGCTAAVVVPVRVSVSKLLEGGRVNRLLLLLLLLLECFPPEPLCLNTTG